MNMEYNGFRDDVEKVVLLAPAGAEKTTWCIERINVGYRELEDIKSQLTLF